MGALAHTIPLWVFLMDTVVFRVRPTPAKWLGLLLGLSAIALLASRNFQATHTSAWGVAAILTGGLCWAIGANIMKRVPWGAPAITVLGWQALIDSIPLALVALPYVDDIGPIGVQAWIGGSYSTLIGVAFALWLWFKILELVPVWVAAYSAPCRARGGVGLGGFDPGGAVRMGGNRGTRPARRWRVDGIAPAGQQNLTPSPTRSRSRSQCAIVTHHSSNRGESECHRWHCARP